MLLNKNNHLAILLLEILYHRSNFWQNVEINNELLLYLSIYLDIYTKLSIYLSIYLYSTRRPRIIYRRPSDAKFAERDQNYSTYFGEFLPSFSMKTALYIFVLCRSMSVCWSSFVSLMSTFFFISVADPVHFFRIRIRGSGFSNTDPDPGDPKKTGSGSGSYFLMLAK